MWCCLQNQNYVFSYSSVPVSFVGLSVCLYFFLFRTFFYRPSTSFSLSFSVHCVSFFCFYLSVCLCANLYAPLHASPGLTVITCSALATLTIFEFFSRAERVPPSSKPKSKPTSQGYILTIAYCGYPNTLAKLFV